MNTCLAIPSLVAATFILTISSSVSAQNVAGVPLFGARDLTAGFMPDPVEVGVDAGGTDLVEVAGTGVCAGFINNAAPDVHLYYTSGTFPLNIYVEADVDTTLVISAPDGQWYCDDGTHGLDPEVSFTTPQSGGYSIWVGTFDSTSTPRATLHISEMVPQWESE